MNRTEFAKNLEKISQTAEEADRIYLKELRDAILKGRSIEHADDYIDLLLGIAETCDADLEEKIYPIIDYVTEKSKS